MSSWFPLAVRSFGTENRPTDRPVAPRDEVYEYIIFRGSDIKDIRFVEPPKPQPTLQGGLPNDPAILQVRNETFCIPQDFVFNIILFYFSTPPLMVPARPAPAGTPPAARSPAAPVPPASSRAGRPPRSASAPSAPAPPSAAPAPTPPPLPASLRPAAHPSLRRQARRSPGDPEERPVSFAGSNRSTLTRHFLLPLPPPPPGQHRRPLQPP